jgi:hypothetical protein
MESHLSCWRFIPSEVFGKRGKYTEFYEEATENCEMRLARAGENMTGQFISKLVARLFALFSVKLHAAELWQVQVHVSSDGPNYNPT